MAKKIAVVNRELCVSCGVCRKVCPIDAMTIFKGCYALPLSEKCVGCGKCKTACPGGFIEIADREAF